MWPFILILAIVPMIFFWSDSVETLFPQLSKFLPDKDKASPAVIAVGQAAQTSENQGGGEPGRWYELSSTKSYVAWSISMDGHYRLAVGCHEGQPAVMQVTSVEGHTLPDRLALNFATGTLPLDAATYTGPELVPATAQFKTVFLESPTAEVYAQFSLDGFRSNQIARTIQTFCRHA